MSMKTPEERRAIAAKSVETRRRNRLAERNRIAANLAAAEEMACGLDQLRKERDALTQQIEFGRIANVLAGTALLSEHEIVAGAKPWSMFCGVYFLISCNRVVYVGQSVNVFARIAQHSTSGKQFDRFAFVPCKSESLNFLESLYIHLLRPSLNGVLPAGGVIAPLNLETLLAAAGERGVTP